MTTIKETYAGKTVKECLLTALQADLDKLYAGLNDEIGGRDGHNSLIEKIRAIEGTVSTAQDAANAAQEEITDARDGNVSLLAKEQEQDAILDEVIAARDGNASLLAKEQAQDLSIASLAAGSGVTVSPTDQTVSSLSDKIVSTDSSVTFSVISPGGYEIFNLSSLSAIKKEDRTSNTIIQNTDRSKIIEITSGTFTQTISSSVSLGDGWFCYIKNSGTGDVTIDPYGSEFIDGLTSYIMYPGECRLLQCNGTTINSTVINSFYKIFTASTNFIVPPGYRCFEADVIGSGGGAGKSSLNTTNNRFAGGGGSRVILLVFNLTDGSLIAIIVAAGGIGATTINANGGDGGTSSFGTIKAFGGTGNGNGGSGIDSHLVPDKDALGWCGTFSGAEDSYAYNGEWGGGSGPCRKTGAKADGGSSLFGAGGGGGGGYNAYPTGGDGGKSNRYSPGGGGPGSPYPADGLPGADGSDGSCGSGGGGGGYSPAGHGSNGGNGGRPGGGGGLGGAGTSEPGNGGTGARGEVRVRGVI